MDLQNVQVHMPDGTWNYGPQGSWMIQQAQASSDRSDTINFDIYFRPITSLPFIKIDCVLKKGLDEVIPDIIPVEKRFSRYDLARGVVE